MSEAPLAPLADWPRGLRRRAQPAAGLPALETCRPSPQPAHPGLWLDRMLQWPAAGRKSPEGDWPARRALYEGAITALRPPGRGGSSPPVLESYQPLFERWRKTVEAPAVGLSRAQVELVSSGRILLHPAIGATVTEGAVLLHHTYGVPYLPGSALKGAVRRVLRALAPGNGDGSGEGPGTLAGEILGRSAANEDAGVASLVDFLDALWIPEPPAGAAPGWSPLALDVVTPHHPAYYSKPDKPDPLVDGEEPVPTQRLTLAPGCRFLAVAEAAEPFPAAWLEWLMLSVLPSVLEEEGLGAWTAAGYGRLRAPSVPRLATLSTAAPPAASSVTWHRATVSLQPNTGELQAVLPGGRRATARNPDAAALRAALPEPSARRLAQKREATFEVRVDPVGTAWRIVEMRLARGDAE